jgi:hypothetical protein
MTTFGIWCEVSGGVTGHREAWLKENGKRVEFDNESDAEATALQMRLERRQSSASFRYTARPIQGNER